MGTTDRALHGLRRAPGVYLRGLVVYLDCRTVGSETWSWVQHVRQHAGYRVRPLRSLFEDVGLAEVDSSLVDLVIGAHLPLQVGANVCDEATYDTP